jgi:hypothetical protein
MSAFSRTKRASSGRAFFFKSSDQPVERLVGFQSEQKLAEVMNRLLQQN